MKHPKIESYAGIIKSVLSPLLSPARIPELLDALVDVEEYREIVLPRAAVWLSFDAMNASDIRLDHEEKELVQEQVAESKNTRSLYIELIKGYCLLVSSIHIHLYIRH
jgi:hypothetical protein